jgi:DNA-binding NarL/FixJ family response regulator
MATLTGQARLSPRTIPSSRMQQVLRGLLRGLGEKQIAAELVISRHTVHVYVKLLYRRLSVSSRAELMARWIGTRQRQAAEFFVTGTPELWDPSDALLIGC